MDLFMGKSPLTALDIAVRNNLTVRVLDGSFESLTLPGLPAKPDCWRGDGDRIRFESDITLAGSCSTRFPLHVDSAKHYRTRRQSASARSSHRVSKMSVGRAVSSEI